MNIKELVRKYVSKGFSLRNAKNIVAEEIMILKIAATDMADRVTIKGGFVMYNLTKNDRRVTKDIDFDLIRYSIDKDSIKLFLNKMNRINDGIKVSIEGRIVDLNQEDYRGVRVNTILSDEFNNKLRLKLDIGVHTYLAIEQDRMLFKFDSSPKGVEIKVNPPEQIFAEKLISLGRHGALSTRYKDIYDLYYLLKFCDVSSKMIREIITLFFENSSREPRTFLELENGIKEALSNKAFELEASKPTSRWIDVDFEVAKEEIIAFVKTL